VNLPALTDALPRLEANPLEESDRFEGPVLFIAGGDSHYVEPGDHAVIRRHFPRAEIRVLPGCGHNPHMEARAEFVAAVLG
jgi:pimeloyl-ACP methyl ester carboxylesterase